VAKLLTILVIIPSVIPSQNGPKTLTDVLYSGASQTRKTGLRFRGLPRMVW